MTFMMAWCEAWGLLSCLGWTDVLVWPLMSVSHAIYNPCDWESTLNTWNDDENLKCCSGSVYFSNRLFIVNCSRIAVFVLNSPLWICVWGPHWSHFNMDQLTVSFKVFSSKEKYFKMNWWVNMQNMWGIKHEIFPIGSVCTRIWYLKHVLMEKYTIETAKIYIQHPSNSQISFLQQLNIRVCNSYSR